MLGSQAEVRQAPLFDADSYRGAIYISGAFHPVVQTAPVLEKATGEEIFTTGVASPQDVDVAVRDARAAQREWEKRTPTERGDVIRRFASLLSEYREEVMTWVIRETGAIRQKGAFDVDLSVRESLEAATLATRPAGLLLTDGVDRQSVARRVPVGVVGVITPWNSPLILAVRSVMPALALGNAVVLKPDVQTPICGGLIMARLFELAGLPKGLFHVLPGGAETGEAVVAHPQTAVITFTGSTPVGRRVGEVGGRLLKRTALELGGKNAYIVCNDADVDRAVTAGSFGSFFHQGQICFTIGRHLVHKDIADEYTAKLAERARRLKVGDPFREDVHLGPLVNLKQAERAERILTESVQAGAKVLAGGTRDGQFFQPTVLTNVSIDMPVFVEETFGPIAAVLPVENDEEAIELANATEFGLVAAIQTSSLQRANAIANRLNTGIIHINDQPVIHEVYGPIGGMGASGNGARTGLPAWEHEFTQWQWVTSRPVSPEYPF